MRHIFTLFVFFIALAVQAQVQREGVDIVVLKDGKELVGKIIIHREGEEMVFRNHNGEEITIQDEEIAAVREQVWGVDAAYVQKEQVADRVLGWYNMTALSLSAGRDNEGNTALGSGVSNTTGYQFSPFLGVGLGIGMDRYNREGETLYPVFMEIRSFVPYTRKPNFLYISVAGGYGLAAVRRSKRIRDAEGGWMFHPAAGVRTATREGVDITLDAGLRVQEASFTRDLVNGDVEIRDYCYRRLVFRLGIVIK